MKQVLLILISLLMLTSVVFAFSITACADYYDNSSGLDEYDFAVSDENAVAQKNDIASRFLNPQSIIISLIAGAIIGFIGVSIMKSNLTSVHKQEGAMNYAVQGSLEITEENDTLVGTDEYRFAKSKPVKIDE
ncbi:MAG: hypothetical protein IK085_07930 [Clostridia bacterium]|nr:hypothetical protein [Clostridia bacterium]